MITLLCYKGILETAFPNCLLDKYWYYVKRNIQNLRPQNGEEGTNYSYLPVY